MIVLVRWVNCCGKNRLHGDESHLMYSHGSDQVLLSNRRSKKSMKRLALFPRINWARWNLVNRVAGNVNGKIRRESKHAQ